MQGYQAEPAGAARTRKGAFQNYEMKKSGTAEALLFRLFCPRGQKGEGAFFVAWGTHLFSQEVVL